MARKRSRRVAVVDLGTNSLRTLVADCFPDGTYRRVEDEKIACRLGEGMIRKGGLTATAMERTMQGLRRALSIARGYEVDRVEAIATSAVREAANGEAFLARVKAELGLAVRVVTGDQEARLAYLSLRRHFDLTRRPTISLDLGGGSLEVVVVARDELVESVMTLPLGAVRLTEEYLPDPVITARQYKRLRKAVKAVLKEKLGEYADQGHALFGSGGSLTTLGRVRMLRRGKEVGDLMGVEIPRSDLRHLREILRSLPLPERRKVPGLGAERADIIVAAAVVLEETMRVLRSESLTVNAQGIREGVLLDLMKDMFHGRGVKEVSPGASRVSTVRAFARSCNYEEPHAEHVRRLSLSILDQLEPPRGMDVTEGRLLLDGAALLHDVGNLVRFEGHHKHTQHMIMSAELVGFTQRQRALLALVARFHTARPPTKGHRSLADLSRPDRRLVLYLAGILRIADGLDRCHCQRIQSVRVRQGRSTLRLRIHSTSNPELEVWAAKRKANLLEKVLGLRVRIDAVADEAAGAPIGGPAGEPAGEAAGAARAH